MPEALLYHFDVGSGADGHGRARVPQIVQPNPITPFYGCSRFLEGAALDRLAAAPVNERLVIRDLWLLRMLTLLARKR